MNPRIRIHLWSGPRNISTALMYSFAQRNDTQVVDEPLYAHYLQTSGAKHPGREEVLASQENNGLKVVEGMMEDNFNKPVVFFKQMTHHLVNLAPDFLLLARNILLIRDPKKVLASFARVVEHPVLQDIGIRQNFELFHFLVKNHTTPVVMDSRDVLNNPEKMLRRLCEKLELDFQPAMLHWEAGPRPEDGVWAKHWYQNVHRSTGFTLPEETETELPGPLIPVYEEAKIYYGRLREFALQPDE